MSFEDLPVSALPYRPASSQLDIEMLRRLLRATGQLVQMVSCRDKRMSWNTLTRLFCETIDADQVAFLLSHFGDDPETLRLLSRYSRDGRPTFLAPEVLEGLLGLDRLQTASAYLQTCELRTRCFHYELPRPHEFLEAEVDSRVFEQQAHSSLWAILKGRHGHVLGVLIAARLHRSEDEKDLPFGAFEEEAASWFVQSASHVLEVLRLLKGVRDLRKRVHRSNSAHDIMVATQETACRLLRSRSGGIAIRRPGASPAVIYGPQYGEGRPEEGQAIPEEDIVYRALTEAVPEEESNWGLSEDRRVARALLQWSKGYDRTGLVEVVAAEGIRFVPEDLDLLRWVARHAASDTELVEHRRDLAQWESDLTKDDARSIAHKLKERIKADLELDGVLLYVLVPRTNNLMSIDGVAPAVERDFRKTPYIYGQDEKSAATYAFKKRSFSCTDPWQDELDRVNKEGLGILKIYGSLFAISLGEGGKRFGSVIAWFSENRCEPGELRAIQAKLEELVRCATNPLRLALSAAQKTVLHTEVAGILQQMMQESDLRKNLERILRSIEKIGFTRVRLYQFRFGDTLIGIMSRGMKDRSRLFGGENLYTVNVHMNNYTSIMYDGVRRARKRAPNYNHSDLLARLYPLKDTRGNLIEDNSAVALDKPAEMPWAEVPVISAGKLYGLIAADKLKGKDDWDQILEMDLDALDALAQIAGRAFAMDEKRGMLIQKNLRVLDEHVGLDVQLQLVQRRLLHFLTHGEEGLGFSRACFLKPSDEQSGAYHFEHGVGPRTGQEWAEKLASAQMMSLEAVMDDADLGHDRSLNNRLAAFQIEGISENDPLLLGRVCRYRPGEANTPDWVARLWNLLKENDTDPMPEILAVRLNTMEGNLGLFVVDRKWDEFGLIKADEESLESFSRHAAQILLRHEALNRRLHDIDLVIDLLIHEPMGPLAKMRQLLQLVRAPKQSLNRGDFKESLALLVDALDEFVRLFTDLNEVFWAGAVLEFLDQSQLVNHMEEALATLLTEMKGSGIEFEWSFSVTTDVFQIQSSAIAMVARNLILNAFEAFQGIASHKDQKFVIVRISLIRRSTEAFLEMTIENNAGHVGDEGLKKMHDPLSTFTTKSKKGGLGLLISRSILRKYAGTLSFENIGSQKFRAKVTVPIILGEP